MGIRWSRLATGMLVITLLILMADQSWAIREKLGPSKDEWGLKYDVAVHETDGDKLAVVFTLTDEGRLKPFYSLDLVVFSIPKDSRDGSTYEVNEPIKLKPTPDGKRQGKVQVRKKYLDRAKIRIITLSVDGKPQVSGGAFYDIPIKKYLKKSPTDASPASSAAPASNPSPN